MLDQTSQPSKELLLRADAITDRFLLTTVCVCNIENKIILEKRIVKNHSILLRLNNYNTTNYTV